MIGPLSQVIIVSQWYAMTDSLTGYLKKKRKKKDNWITMITIQTLIQGSDIFASRLNWNFLDYIQSMHSEMVFRNG